MKAPRLVSLLLVLFAASVGEQLFGQEQPIIAPDTRVRVSAPSHDMERVVGSVLALKPDTLVVAVEGQPLVLPLAAVTSLEVSQGMESKTKTGTLIGALAGAGAGTIIALASCEDNGCSYEGYDATWTVVLLFGGSGAGVGALIGSLVGRSIKVEGWETVPLDQFRVSLTPRRGRLEVSARFVF